jgi:hypothetical protein
MSDSIDNNEKEIRVLVLVEQLANLLQDNTELQDKVAEKLGRSKSAASLRQVILSRREVQFYYNEEDAEMLRPFLDRMIEADCKVPIDFPRSATPQISPRTVYLRIYQGWQWLRDKHKDKEKYIKLYDRTTIRTDMKLGVRIAPKVRDIPALVAVEVDESFDHLLKLQNSISAALAQPQTIDFAIIFDKKNLRLTEEDQDKIKDSLAGLEGITVNTTASSVLIGRRIN